MNLDYSEVFAAEYAALPDEAVSPINELLDDLEQHHDQPEMRNVLRLDSGSSIFATRRVEAGGVAYRITWIYSGDEAGAVILCLTVADSTIHRSP